MLENIPKDKSYPPDSVQCGRCGGFGCGMCNDKGWLTPKSHEGGRRCERAGCKTVLPPAHVAVYCSDECAAADA
jgi:hypothetical protein